MRHPDGKCPFCRQGLATSDIIEHYRAYFSAQYRQLQTDLESADTEHRRSMSDAARLRVERSLVQLSADLAFWSQFVQVPAIAVDADALAERWGSAQAEVARLVDQKRRDPLTPIAVDAAAQAAIDNFNAFAREVGPLNGCLPSLADKMPER